jgi:hypothetical protein
VRREKRSDNDNVWTRRSGARLSFVSLEEGIEERKTGGRGRWIQIRTMAMVSGGEGSSQVKKPAASGMTIPTEDTQKNVNPDPPGILRDPLILSARKMNTDIPEILPHERVFPIQIGSELFRLSGASISSDGKYSHPLCLTLRTQAKKARAPSYFSQFFQCQLKQAEENGDQSKSIRTLYIDRDPVTFKDISLHLQGYHVTPKDASHFVKLYADAQFYSREYFPPLQIIDNANGRSTTVDVPTLRRKHLHFYRKPRFPNTPRTLLRSGQ